MGEGKTRVILPMLILKWANGQNLVRLTLLPALLEEAYSHLHSCLCASMLGVKLFLQPFHRDVQVSNSVLVAMRSALGYCKQVGGVLCTTPERRLSVGLKRQELYEKGEHDMCAALDLLEGLPYVDLLDESDELLSHRYQLIYAWGGQQKLPSEQARACAVQALLHILSEQHNPKQHAIGATLARQGVAVWGGPASASKPGAFRGLRLLPGQRLEAALPQLRRQLAEALLSNPPYAMRWMWGHPHKEALLRCMTDPTVDASSALSGMPGLPDEEKCDMLALRGLLAFGVLEHCLMQRHLVDYGVNRSPTARKRLAVPFRAAHVPSERSEYAHPDTTLALTTLAYYGDGLSMPQLLDTLRELLHLGQNAQKDHYAEWLQLAPQGAIPPELDDVVKLDTTNSQQMQLMYTHFSHNMGTVDFWLNTCVFPTETRQFPQRLVANAWHLADNPRSKVVGFSGTNDNHRLLPLLVRQHLEVEAGLRATNGKMLAVILNNPQYNTLEPQDGESIWQALLHFAVHNKLDALIDCGALLAGTTNRAAAEYLLPLLDWGRFKGVCFFDEASKAWVVVDLQGRCSPRHCSPIQESQAFSVFDEARCRGADLQLRPDAVGLLTLSPATSKDKLMQATGRMRKLGKGQTLRIVGTTDVTDRIMRCANAHHAGGSAGRSGGSRIGTSTLTSRDVLQWVMVNTVAATLRGVVEWGHQGLLFASTHHAPEHALQPETLELEELYSSSRHHVEAPQVVREQRSRRARAGLAPAMEALMGEIVACGELHGAGHLVVAQGVLGEECERELEREEEEEEEVERQVERIEPLAERDWAYAKALGATSLQDFQQRTALELLPLASLIKQLQPEGIRHLPWSPGLYCTPNFAFATKPPPGGGMLNEYLRAVDALLLLPAGGSKGGDDGGLAVVLLSEREHNALLELLWQHAGAKSMMTHSWLCPKPPALLASLLYACLEQQAPTGSASQGHQAAKLPLAVALVSDGGWPVPGRLAGEVRAGRFLPQLVSLQLFNGETTYVDPRQLSGGRWEDMHSSLPPLRQLRALVGGHGAAAEALVGMRGKQSLFSRSQLERACYADGHVG